MTTPIRLAARRRLAALVATLVSPLVRRDRRGPRARPVPGRRPVRPGPAPDFRWRSGSEPAAAIKTAIKAAAADANEHHGPRRRPTFAYDASGANPIGYGAGATCGVNGIACFTRDAPTGFTMWLREQGHVFDWGTLKWCQTYRPRRTAATTPRRSRSTNSATSTGSATTKLRRRIGLSRRRRPDLLADEAEPGWNMHAFGRCDVGDAPAAVRHGDPELQVLDLPGPRHGPALAASPTPDRVGGSTTLTATLKVVDDEDYRRSAATRSRAGRSPSSVGARGDDLDDRRDDGRRRDRARTS